MYSEQQSDKIQALKASDGPWAVAGCDIKPLISILSVVWVMSPI